MLLPLSAVLVGDQPHHAQISAGTATDHRGSRFIGFREFARFTRAAGIGPQELTFTSPEVDPGIGWNELIVSWNAEFLPGGWLEVGARVVYPDHATRYYTMGIWSPDPARHPRESVRDQKDADGDVHTDTLAVTRPGGRVQIRITLGADSEVVRPNLRFLGLSFSDTNAKVEPLAPNKAAWGRTNEVPERSQLSHPDGAGWCSPTSLGMVMAYWGAVLKRTDLVHETPEIAAAVNDPNWPGTGNWPFNTAYAGGFPGVRAYVTRLSDVSELEDWVAAGVPVIVSVAYKLLHEKGTSMGHIAVCVGFTAEGDPIIQDPWARLDQGDKVRVVCPRRNLIDAWAVSHNTVYLVCPESQRVPADRFGHWDSDGR